MNRRRRAVATLVVALACIAPAACGSGSGTATGLGRLSGAPIVSAGPPLPGPSPAPAGATPAKSRAGGSTPTKGTSSSSTGSTSASPAEIGDYAVSIAHPQGTKRCTWRLAPGHNGIALGFGVNLSHTGPLVTAARVPVTMTIVESGRSASITLPAANDEVASQPMDVPGVAPGTSAYTVHITASIDPPGPDLNSGDNSVSATLSVPVGTPTSTVWSGIPCT